MNKILTLTLAASCLCLALAGCKEQKLELTPEVATPIIETKVPAETVLIEQPESTEIVDIIENGTENTETTFDIDYSAVAKIPELKLSSGTYGIVGYWIGSEGSAVQIEKLPADIHPNYLTLSMDDIGLNSDLSSIFAYSYLLIVSDDDGNILKWSLIDSGTGKSIQNMSLDECAKQMYPWVNASRGGDIVGGDFTMSQVPLNQSFRAKSDTSRIYFNCLNDTDKIYIAYYSYGWSNDSKYIVSRILGTETENLFEVDFSFDEDDAARLTFSEISAARFAHVMRAETTVISTTAEGSGFFTRYIYNDTNNIAYLVLDHDSGERQIEVISPGEVVENDFSPFACSMYYSFTEPQA